MSRRFGGTGIRRPELREGPERQLTPAFTPASMTGIWAWYRADQGVTLDTGKVSQWNDLSGNGRHITQTTASLRPTLETASSSFGNLDCIRMSSNGTSTFTYLNLPSMAALTAGHIFIIWKLDANPGSQGVAGLWAIGNTAAGANFYRNPGDTTIYDAFGSTTRKATGNFAVAATNTHVYEAVSKANSWTNRQNGTQIATTGTNTVQFIASPLIGGNGVDVGQNTRIGEIVILSAEATAGNRTSLISYINTRYGISAT